jgi:two-component system chemotaxis response regulator CheB
MWKINEGDLIRYRCHVGHAYTAGMMALALDENLTRALANSLRVLDGRIALTRKLRDQATNGGHHALTRMWARKAQ